MSIASQSACGQSAALQQMLHRGGIRAAQRQRLSRSPLAAGPCPAVCPVSADRSSAGCRPACPCRAISACQSGRSSPASVRRWRCCSSGRRSGQSPRLPPQHVQIMLQIENLLLPPVAALMPRHAIAVLPELHVLAYAWPEPRARPAAAPSRSSSAPCTQPSLFTVGKLRLAPGPTLAGQAAADAAARSAAPRRRSGLARRSMRCSILPAVAPATADSTPPDRGLRHRHPVIAPEVPAFAFHAAFLVACAGVQNSLLKPPVRTEGDEASRLFPALTAQDLLHRALQVVVAKPLKDSAEVAERQFVRFQKRLLRGVQKARWKAAPLAMLRIENTCSFVRSPARSA